MSTYGPDDRALFESQATELFEEVVTKGGLPTTDPRIAENGELRTPFSLLLENGKPMLALETTDAVTKRKMSIEVKATVQK